MSFRILCITNGSHIKIPATIAWQVEMKMPSEIIESLSFDSAKLAYKYYTLPKAWEYAEFTTEEGANWFLSHRLVYNPRRKDPQKLEFMRQLFEFNDIPGWQTVKLEFEVEKV